MTNLRRAGLSPAKLSLLDDRIERAASSTSKPVAIPRRSQQDFLPLSYAQEGLWALSQIDPEQSAFNNPVALRLRGKLETKALELAFNALLQRHNVLNYRFRSGFDRPVQQLLPAKNFEISVVDFSSLSKETAEQEAVQRIQAEVGIPLNLYSSPLVRAHLLRISDDDHILLMVFHHLTIDAWSKGIVLSELGNLYSAVVEEKKPDLPDLQIQYADFAAWQRSRLKSPKVQVQLELWKAKLRDLPPIFELPPDHKRRSMMSSPAGVLSFHLDEPIIHSLQRVGLENDATLAMVLLTNFLILLQRFCGQSDLVIGLPIAGRTEVQTENLIGLFINTLVFRCDLSGNPRFCDALILVRREAEEVYSNQEIPLEKLVSEVPHQRDQGRPPFFQILFNYKNIPASEIGFTGLTASLIPTQMKAVRYDLTLEMARNGDRINASFIYNAALYDETTITRLIESFNELLCAIIQNPLQKIGNLPLLNHKTLEMMLNKWNRTEITLSRDSSVIQLFEQQALRRPQAAAIHYLDLIVTYAELDELSNRIAAYLQCEHQLAGQIAAIYLDSTPELVMCILAVLKAGAAFLVLDPQLPHSRLESILQDARPAVILSDSERIAGLEVQNSVTFLLDSEMDAINQYPNEKQKTKTFPEQLAYLIYTSQSSGSPKGVMVPQSSLLNHTLWSQQVYRICEADSILQSKSLSFDPFIAEIFDALISGATLHIMPPNVRWDPAAIIELVQDQNITFVDLVPAQLQLLIEDRRFYELQSIRQVRCGGDVLPQNLAEKFRKISTAELHNLYGPAETCIDSTHYFCDVINPNNPVPIGKPIANTQAYILDDNLQPVPVGVVGELYIAGKGLAWGYFKHPDWTADFFIPNPFGAEGSRMYRTGDLANFQADGNIKFIGSKDRQVKIHGVRIELGDIEQTIMMHPNVRIAAVEASQSNSTQSLRLVAYIVQDGDAAETLRTLKRFLQHQLPGTMIPEEFYFLENIPLLPGGQVDHNGLQRFTGNKQFPHTPLSPCKPFEFLAADIWSEILQTPVVDMQTNFFDLGGNSLLAIRLLARFNDLLGAEISISILYETETLLEFVKRIETIMGAGANLDQRADIILKLLKSPDTK